MNQRADKNGDIQVLSTLLSAFPIDLQIIGVSALIATRERTSVLSRTLKSLQEQGVWPRELIVVDASDTHGTCHLIREYASILPPEALCHYVRSSRPGAASQRMEGMALARQPVIWFLDDDIIFESECVLRLWQAITTHAEFGAVNAMIINQKLVAPGTLTKAMLWLMGGSPSYGGRLIGPAINVLPEDRDDLPELVPVQWLNTTCTMYRREALPQPLFPDHFKGYSLMEDVCLSVTISRQWQLANVRTARIYHDSQPGSHKQDPVELRRMALVNRYYVMTKVLGKRGLLSHLRLLLWELFGLVSVIKNRTGVVSWIKGSRAAVKEIRGHN